DHVHQAAGDRPRPGGGDGRHADPRPAGAGVHAASRPGQLVGPARPAPGPLPDRVQGGSRGAAAARAWTRRGSRGRVGSVSDRAAALGDQPTPAPRRRRAPRGQGELLREEIIDATERLLLETGDQDAVSIRAVAEAVGVTPPSIYLHFADKIDLIFAVCERHFARFDEIQEAAAAEFDDPVESLMARGRAYVRFGL